MANQCGEPIQSPIAYTTHKACALAGYAKSIEVLNSMEEKDVNTNRLFFSFTCTQADYI